MSNVTLITEAMESMDAMEPTGKALFEDIESHVNLLLAIKNLGDHKFNALMNHVYDHSGIDLMIEIRGRLNRLTERGMEIAEQKR